MREKIYILLLSLLLTFSYTKINIFANDILENKPKIRDLKNGVSLNKVCPKFKFNNLNFGSPIDISNKINIFKENPTITILIDFVPTNRNKGSLLSVSNNMDCNKYFHIYTLGESFGYELKGCSNENNIKSFEGIKIGNPNTMALKINNNNKLFEIFLNGEKVMSEKFTNPISDIPEINTVYLGKTAINNDKDPNEYAFSGQIKELKVYTKAILNEHLLEYTAKTTYEKPTQIFNETSTNSKYNRMPSMYTLNDGTVIATINSVFGLFDNSPNKISIALRKLKNNSNEWSEVTFPVSSKDYSNKEGYNKKSTLFTNANIVQDLSGKIHLTVNVFPAGYGYNNIKVGSGYKEVERNRYLALSKRNNYTTTDFKNFDYHIKNNKIYDSITGRETEYTIDSNFNLYRDGKELKIKQKNLDGSYSGEEVQMNIFFENSDFRIYPTSYLLTMTSQDGGNTWSETKILNHLKNENEKIIGVTPGRGLVITKGQYKGRILIPIYDNQNGERSSIIYSDDNGDTWNRGNRVIPSHISKIEEINESQLVELPDGSIRMYARTNSPYICYADSFNGGTTFEPIKEDKNLPYNSNSENGGMISVINYIQKINGKDAIILSSQEGEDKNNSINGIIRVGLIEEYFDVNGKIRYNINWKYVKKINQDQFQYSCLTEFQNGDIGILYESSPDAPTLFFQKYKLGELLN